MSNHRVQSHGWRAHLDKLYPTQLDWCFLRAILYVVISHVLFTSRLNETGTLTTFGILYGLFAVRALMQAHALMIKTGKLR